MNTNNRFDIAYLGLVPVAHQSEGLNVLLCDTIRPLIDNAIEVVVHTTDRHEFAVRKALSGNGINLATISIRSYRVGSIGLSTLLNWLHRKKIDRSKSNRRISLSTLFRPTLRRIFTWMVDLTILNFPLKLFMLLVAGFIGISLGIMGPIVLLPVLLPIAFLLILRRFSSTAIGFLRARPRILRVISRTRRRFISYLSNDLLHTLYANEQIRFASTVSHNPLVDRLFFFTAFEGHAIRAFKGKKLVVFPDAVTALYPTRFSGYHNINSYNSFKISIANSDAIVCYSNFVRDQQLFRFFKKECAGKVVTVIPQGYFLPADIVKDSNSVALELNNYRGLIKNLFPNLLHVPPVVDFRSFDYIIYPTIDRPHKNTLVLIKAFEILLRQKHMNLKIILTTPDLDSDAKRLVLEKRLQYDILFMPSVPVKVLNDLFLGASLMVHSSLAEGGDVFNFSRAVSAGCPALMADIPVVREMFDRDSVSTHVYENWLFDPYDANMLADKIEKLMGSPDKWLGPQKSVLEKLSSHSFKSMAFKYFDCLKGL